MTRVRDSLLLLQQYLLPPTFPLSLSVSLTLPWLWDQDKRHHQRHQECRNRCVSSVCVCDCAGCVCGVCLVYGYTALDTLHSAASTVEHDLKTILLHLSLFYLLFFLHIVFPVLLLFLNPNQNQNWAAYFFWYFWYFHLSVFCLTSFSSLLEIQKFIKIFCES